MHNTLQGVILFTVNESGFRPTLICGIRVFRCQMSKITDIVTGIVTPVVQEQGCSLWDVEYVKEAGNYYLRIYIDKPEGVNITDCEEISRKIDPMLDEADPIPESYYLEVCSAGIERELKRPSDFLAFIGSEVELRLYKPFNGQKNIIGTLNDYQDGQIKVLVNDTEYSFNKKETALVKLHINF